MIRIRLCGAAGEVTGSGYLVETPTSRVLVDFGIFQGGPDAHERSRSLGPVEPRHLNAVVLTHAHVDHSGRLPLLVAAGYTGPLYASHATLDLTEILLADMARLEKEDLRRTNRRRRRAGEPELEPLYTPEDVDRLHSRARPLRIGQRQEVARNVSARLFEAGHILGSTSLELTIDDDGRERTLVFSGDIGPCGAPILRDPERPQKADLVVMESTYGGRDRASSEQTVKRFKEIVEHAAKARERVIIPAFAVGRTQVILYYLAEAVREDRLPRDFPIYLDSPMADKATQAVLEHPELYDDEAAELRRRRQIRSDLRGLRVTESVEDSMALNDSDHPCIIISASGMCEGGRIVHHLRHNLWRPNANLLLVGYMAEGTLGRQLAEAAKRVEIFGEEIAVRAQVHRLDGFSAHAGHSELLDWLSDVAPTRPRVVLTHGEDDARAALADAIAERYSIITERPQLDDIIVLE